MDSDKVALWTERKEAEFRDSRMWNWPTNKVVSRILLGPLIAMNPLMRLATQSQAPSLRAMDGILCFGAGVLTAWNLHEWATFWRKSREALANKQDAFSGSPSAPQ